MNDKLFEYRRGLANGLSLALDLASQAETAQGIRQRLGAATAAIAKIRTDGDCSGGMLATVRRDLREHFRQLEAAQADSGKQTLKS
jgi:hypothetical protein